MKKYVGTPGGKTADAPFLPLGLVHLAFPRHILGHILGRGKVAEDMQVSQQLGYLSCVLGPSQDFFLT